MLDFLARCKPLFRILLATLTVLAVAVALAYAAVFLYIAARRLAYPFELDWIESGFVEQVGRILDGRSVYGPPSIEFTPFLYTPLFFYLSAAAAEITGPGFLPLRLVSVVSACTAIAGTFAIVYRRNKNFAAGVVAAGLLAASYRITGAWLDVGRVDSLSVALLVLFCLALPSSPDRTRWTAAGVLAGLMVLTKQSMLIVVAPFFAVHVLQYRRRALWMAAGFLLPLCLVTAALSFSSDGWFSFYTVELLGQQADWLSREVIIGFWKTDILRHYFVSLAFGAAGLYLLFRERRKKFWEWSALLAGALMCSFLARIKAGGFDNVLLPSVAVIGILLGLGWDRLSSAVVKNPCILHDAVGIVLMLAVLYQYYHLRYSPTDQLPTDRHYRTGEAFVALLESLPGEVYVPYHTHYAVLAGKQTYAHQAALWDVLRGESDNRGKEILARGIEEAIRAQLFETIILDGDGQWNFLYGLETYYTQQPEPLDPDVAPTPLTGWLISPGVELLPAAQAQSRILSPPEESGRIPVFDEWMRLFPFLVSGKLIVMPGRS